MGNYRVQALSPTLLRVEPKGPNGFENRTSFMVVTEPSKWAGIPISKKSEGPEGTLLTTASYNVLLGNSTQPPPQPEPTCSSPLAGYDVSSPQRSTKFPDGAQVSDEAACCAACSSDDSCSSWVFAPSNDDVYAVPKGKGDVPGANCWPLSSSGSLVPSSARTFGCGPNSKCSGAGPAAELPNVIVTSPSGQVLYNSTADAAASQATCSGSDPNACDDPCFWDKDANQCTNIGAASNLLHWPSPGTAQAYALVDYPRFFAPAWGTAPIPKDAKVVAANLLLCFECFSKVAPFVLALLCVVVVARITCFFSATSSVHFDGVQVDPALVATNGYDFRNNVDGDTYIFLLGDDIDDWHNARREFVTVAGPTPVLPDYAFGTWFTWWHSYTEDEAKGEVERWGTDNLPIDIWALDMNWRNTTNNQDRYYDHPAVPNLFSNFTAWFEYVAARSFFLYWCRPRLYCDHPWCIVFTTQIPSW